MLDRITAFVTKNSVNAIVAILVVGLSLGALLTHICATVMKGEFLLAIGGVLVFPVGVIHGFGIWFNWWA